MTAQRTRTLLKVLGYTAFFGVCFVVSLVITFPYDRLTGYAEAKVTHATTGKPLPGVYVKAYARMQDGAVRFYKDGYTDLRGRFDYTSLSTNELDFAKKFSLLVLSEEHGAVVREANPPQR